MNPELAKIAKLMKAGRADPARARLKQYLERHPDDAEGWYLRSFVEPDSAAKAAAAKKAITLDPGIEKYQTRLAKVQALQRAQRSGRSRRVILGALAIAVIALAGLVVVLLNRRQPETVAQVPTALVMDTAVPSFTPGITAEATSTVLPTTQAPASPEETDEPSTTAQAQPGDSTPLLPVTSAAATPTVGIQPGQLIPLTPAGSPSSALPLTAATPVTQPPQTAPTTTRSGTSPTPTSALASPTPVTLPNITDPGIPITTGQSIGGGDMRVIEATLPGDSLIAELGGAIPGAPEGQSWLLVEALLICSGGQNCAPVQSAINVTGESGATYHASSQLEALPLFGAQFIGGQLWGYLAFAVPTGESNLRLVVTQGSQHSVFALQ